MGQQHMMGALDAVAPKHAVHDVSTMRANAALSTSGHHMGFAGFAMLPLCLGRSSVEGWRPSCRPILCCGQNSPGLSTCGSLST